MKSSALLLIALALAPGVAIAETTPDADYVPCRIHRNSVPHFPLRLLHQGIINGEASVVLEIGTDGRVVDRLLTSYTHPEFGAEADRIVNGWTFDPGTHHGRPIISVLTVQFEFTVNGMAVYERHPDCLKLDDYLARKYAYFPRGVEALDHKPMAVSSSAPVFPDTWITQGHHGRVTIQFYIDETGKPRLPVAKKGGDELLAMSAIEAVKTWRFAPPVASGKPALVLAEQVFVFEPTIADARL